MSNIAIYKEKVPSLADEALTLKVGTPIAMEVATELLSRLNKTLDQIEAEEDKVLAPLKEAVKAEKSRWEPFKLKLKPAIDALRIKIGEYQTKQLAKAKAKEEAILNDDSLDTGKAIKALSSIKTPVTEVATQSGSLTFMTVPKLEITDITKIPRQYLIPDEVAIKKALKEGKKIPGAILKEVQVPRNSR